MIKYLAIAAALIAAPARADQIDYFFKFAGAAQAQADIALAQYYVANQGVSAWRGDVIFQNIQVWKPSQDVTVANPSPPPDTLVTHTYLPGYYLIASLPSPVVPAALNDAQIVVIIDRDTNQVLKNNTGSLAALNALQFSPVPAGSNYPFGAFQ